MAGCRSSPSLLRLVWLSVLAVSSNDGFTWILDFAVDRWWCSNGTTPVISNFTEPLLADKSEVERLKNKIFARKVCCIFTNIYFYSSDCSKIRQDYFWKLLLVNTTKSCTVANAVKCLKLKCLRQVRGFIVKSLFHMRVSKSPTPARGKVSTICISKHQS